MPFSVGLLDARAQTGGMEEGKSSLRSLLGVVLFRFVHDSVPIIPNPMGPTGLPHTREAAALPMLMMEGLLQGKHSQIEGSAIRTKI